MLKWNKMFVCNTITIDADVFGTVRFTYTYSSLRLFPCIIEQQTNTIVLFNKGLLKDMMFKKLWS